MIKFKVSPLLVLMVFLMFFLGYFSECVSYLVAVILHEMSHAEVSRKLGYSLCEIKLAPYGASLTGAFEGVKWVDEIIIALAGPVCNIILAVFCVALWWLVPSTYFFLETFVMSNVFTAIFNLIPIFPLDGGRALLALISKKVPRQKAYKIFRFFGYFLSLIFCGLFIATLFYSPNISFILISIFIMVSTFIPDKNCKYQRLYSMAFRSEKVKAGINVREIMVSESSSVFAMLRLLNGNYYTKFLIVNEKFQVVAFVSETLLEELSSKCETHKTIMEVLSQNSLKT